MTPPRITARFKPQAWVRDYALEVDPQGDTEWDATQAFYALSPNYRSALEAEMAKNFEALDCDDALRSDPNAPEWIRNWSGPFSIYVRRNLDQDFAEAEAQSEINRHHRDFARISKLCEDVYSGNLQPIEAIDTIRNIVG